MPLIRLSFKMVDCGILASRLVLLCDDLLWVLTDTQIQAALHFLNSVSWLMHEAAQVEKKVKAAQKLEVSPFIPHYILSLYFRVIIVVCLISDADAYPSNATSIGWCCYRLKITSTECSSKSIRHV